MKLIDLCREILPADVESVATTKRVTEIVEEIIFAAELPIYLDVCETSTSDTSAY